MLLRCGPCSLSVDDVSVMDYLDHLRQALIEDREASCIRIRALKTNAEGWTAWDMALEAAAIEVENREDPPRFTGDLS